MSDRRQHLLETAATLFAREGFHAVGIDRVLAEAGVAKMTLYRHFPSKEDLIVACVESYGREAAELLSAAWARSEADPLAAVHELFEALAAKAAQPGFAGCPTQQAAAEYPEPEHPVHRAASRCKVEFRSGLRDLAARCGVRDPEGCAAAWYLIAEGVVSAGGAMPGEDQRAAARQLLALTLADASPSASS